MPLMMIPPAEAPAGYPFEYERRIKLRDGSTARVRPIVPDDAEQLAEEIAAADEETLYLRFFTPVVHLDEAKLQRLTRLDYQDRFAVAAFTEDGDGIAIARYDGNKSEAEVAVTVKPDYRRVGLATKLFRILEEAARANGIERLYANYLAKNEPAEALMAASGYGRPTYDSGIATVIKEL